MTARKATHSDIDRLLLWGARFHAQSNWVLEDFSEERVRMTLQNMIASDEAVILMHDQGMIGGVLAPLWFSERTLVAQEMFWFAESDGGLLLKAFEEWARDVGASYLCMAGLKDESGRIQKLYARKGFELTEYHYRKRI